MLVLLGHYVLDLHEKDLELEKLSVVVWVPFGAMCCYLLNSKTGLGSVISAGIIGTLASFLPNVNKHSNYFKKIPPAIYCGVFVGMSSSAVSPSIAYVVTASIIAGLFLLLSKNLFTGFGGKLGTMAFMGVFIVYLIKLVS